MQIPKAQKYSHAVSLFGLLGFVSVKAAHKLLVKLTTTVTKESSGQLVITKNRN